MNAKDFVVVGAGPAGISAVETIRKTNPKAKIALIVGEKEPPYSRMAIPYYLNGDIQEGGTHLRPEKGHFDRLKVNLHHAVVKSLNTKDKKLNLSDGTDLQYDKLLLATGARPIIPPIPGIDLPNVQTCWTLEDARKIARSAKKGARVVLMGAGFIGSIVLEALAKSGVKLTVVEMGDRMVPRMMDETAGNMLKFWCIEKGIQVLTGVKITQISGGDAADTTSPDVAGHAQSVKKPSSQTQETQPTFVKKIVNIFSGGGENTSAAPDETSHARPANAMAAAVTSEEKAPLAISLSDGKTLAADLLVVSAGVTPNTDFLKDSGIIIDGGVVVDTHMHTSVEDIYAAGDVAKGKDFSTGSNEIHAIQPTATEHGRVAALNMCGIPVAYQGSLNMNVLDTLGLISVSFGQWMGVEGGDSAIMHNPGLNRYLRLEFKGNHLVGAQAVGLPHQVGILRGLIQSKTDLGSWKKRLIQHPEQIFEAYVGVTQGS